MSPLLIILPIVIPFAAAILGLLLPNRSALQFANAVVGYAALAAASALLTWHVDAKGFAALQLGDWSAPFGISFVADRLAAIMTLVSSLVGLLVCIYSKRDIEDAARRQWFYPLCLFLSGGVNGAFLTGDLFNLYVWFEVMLIASFALITVGSSRDQFEGGFKYVAINLVASGFFLAGLGLLYGKLGTLNMADAALKLSLIEDSPMINSSGVLLLVAFAIKAGMFPFFFWLPSSYHTPPHSISALFAGLLTKVGVYALFRSYTLVFRQDTGFLLEVMLVLSLATMVTGVMGAASRYDMKKILSFHIISQIGYMTLGLALFTQLALAAALFYTIHHIIVKTNLFLIAGLVERMTGSTGLKGIGGLAKAAPWLATLFLIPALSLGGIPPLSGFWAKFSLIKETLLTEHYWTALIALLVGIATLFSMTKIWAEAFWKKAEKAPEKRLPLHWSMTAPCIAMAAITLAIGLYANPLFAYANRAAEQMLDPRSYIEATLAPDYIAAIEDAANPNVVAAKSN